MVGCRFWDWSPWGLISFSDAVNPIMGDWFQVGKFVNCAPNAKRTDKILRTKIEINETPKLKRNSKGWPYSDFL